MTCYCDLNLYLSVILILLRYSDITTFQSSCCLCDLTSENLSETLAHSRIRLKMQIRHPIAIQSLLSDILCETTWKVKIQFAENTEMHLANPSSTNRQQQYQGNESTGFTSLQVKSGFKVVKQDLCYAKFSMVVHDSSQESFTTFIPTTETNNKNQKLLLTSLTGQILIRWIL